MMTGHDKERQRGEQWLMLALVVGMLAFFCWMLATHYFIRASSDPHNWVKCAHNFRTEILQSRWPYGFPLFLKLLLPIVGPYYIFLVNLPVLILVFVMIWRLGSMQESLPVCRQSPRMFSFTGIAALALVLSADAHLMVQYVNPYRDPLSYVFLFSSVGLFVRGLSLRRTALLFGSGLLLGFACSVREPSVLMLLPLLLYGVIEWAVNKKSVLFWKSSGLFVAGFILALIPLAIQTFLATHQLLLPPQAVIETSVVPGAHFNWEVFDNISRRAWMYYRGQQLWIPVLAAIGLFAALVERQRFLLFLIAPAAILYAVFYSFYWTFIPRYFYVITLLLCLLGGYGIDFLLRRLQRYLPGPWWRRVAWMLVVLLAVVSCRHLKRVQGPRRPFQVADARAIAARMAPLLPDNAVVLAQRHMCELIQVIVLRESYAWSFEPHLITEHVNALWAAGRPVYTVVIPYPELPYGDTIHLRRLYDFEAVETIQPEPYHLSDFALNPFTLYKIHPATRHQVEREIVMPELKSGAGWLALDPGYLSELDPQRSFVNISINGVTVADAISWEGANILELPTELTATGGPLQLKIESDGVLPAEIRATGGDLSQPVELDFDLQASYDNRWRWKGNVLLPDLVSNKLHLNDEATVVLPVLFPRLSPVIVEWQFQCPAMSNAAVEHIDFFEGDVRIATGVVPHDQFLHSLLVTLPKNTEATERRIRVRRRQMPVDGEPRFNIDRVLLHRPIVTRALDIGIGSASDAPYIVNGFYQREEINSPRAFRWTNGEGVLRLPIVQTGADMLLRIHYSVEHAPEEVRPMPITVYWNGQTLPLVDVLESENGTEMVWSGHIPASETEPVNSVMLETSPWDPQEHGGLDTRRLGVMVRRVECKPIE